MESCVVFAGSGTMPVQFGLPTTQSLDHGNPWASGRDLCNASFENESQIRH
jgi:hypothetical protein